MPLHLMPFKCGIHIRPQFIPKNEQNTIHHLFSSQKSLSATEHIFEIHDFFFHLLTLSGVNHFHFSNVEIKY